LTRDLRRYARQTNIRLLVGFIALLLFVGLGLIYLFYGKGAALMGLLCLAIALLPLFLIGLSLLIMDYLIKRARK
jgi:hypothetical protein